MGKASRHHTVLLPEEKWQGDGDPEPSLAVDPREVDQMPIGPAVCTPVEGTSQLGCRVISCIAERPPVVRIGPCHRLAEGYFGALGDHCPGGPTIGRPVQAGAGGR
jgi:hypothetical protein